MAYRLFLKWPWNGYSVPSSTSLFFFDFTKRCFSNHFFFLPLTLLARASRTAITVNNISVFIFKTFFALVISFTASDRFHLRCVNWAPVAREWDHGVDHVRRMIVYILSRPWRSNINGYNLIIKLILALYIYKANINYIILVNIDGMIDEGKFGR